MMRSASWMCGLFAGLLLMSSCLPDQETFTFDRTASLRFSTDTVLFDTVLTSVGSITRRFRVYNDAENAVKINDITLAGGEASPYQVAVNGVWSRSFNEVTLLGRDSMLVLVEVLIDPGDDDLPFLVGDSLVFTTNDNVQSVDLVAYGQDAVFLDGAILDCDMVFTAEKPYVIYNSVLVDTLCLLTIEAGARIYSHVNSYIFVKGTVEARGTGELPVIFRNDRFDEPFNNAPGQWGGIVFLPGSNGNIMEYVKIRNAKTGIYLGTPDEDDIPDLELGHAVIENMGGAEGIPAGDFIVQPGFGLLAITSDAYVYNTLINNCEVNTVGNYAGGNYRYVHCTFAAYSFDFFRQSSSVIFSNNVILADESVLVAPLEVSVVNSILWGSIPDELLLSEEPSVPFTIGISNSLIRTRQYENNPVLAGNILNQDPRFTDPENYDYHLEAGSPAIDTGIPAGITIDLEDFPRDADPDAGSYEFRD